MADPILFEPLAGGETETPPPAGVLNGTIRLRGNALGPSLADVGGWLNGVMQLRMVADAPAPEPPVYGELHGTIHLGMTGYGPGVEAPGTLAGTIRLGGAVYADPNVLRGRIRLYAGLVGGTVFPPFDDFDTTVLISSACGIGADVTIQLGVALLSRLGVHASPSAKFEGHRRITSHAELNDLQYLVYREQILSEAGFGVGVTVDHTAYARLTSHLLLSGEAASLREAHALLVDALAFRDLASAAEYLTLVDDVEFAAAVEVAYAAAARLVDTAALAVSATVNATLYAIMRDDVDLTAAQLATFEGFAALRDTLAFALSAIVDNGQFTAWTMNTDSKGATKYVNYPFNSFLQIGGEWHGVADDGLYRLGGDDDDGEAIQSKLRLGMAALGTRLGSHAVSAYFGYTADGDLRLKVITADSQTGAREAHTYRLYANDAAGSMRNSRAKVGKGLKAVYWDFVIENIDGANFELDVVEILPLVLDRRLRGNAGGKR